MFGSLDLPDLVYLVGGLAFLGLTFQPAFRDHRWFNLPLVYILFGAFLAAALGVPVIDPTDTLPEGEWDGGWQAKVVTHGAELIVIVSLAGAGLAIDLEEGWRRWQPTWRLLGITMPLTILALGWLGLSLLGLSLASAALLAAALAPTDPVLARSVQVGPPARHREGEEEEPTRVGLTAEAGLNDGLAFPFVWLAIALANVTLDGSGAWGRMDWFPEWFGFDLLYRVIVGGGVGWLSGWLLVKLIHSPVGDAAFGAENPALIVLALTFASYGLAEAVDGYGFLAVFMAARAGRALTRDTQAEGYNREAHHMADQLEAILLALVLLWLGTFIGTGLWSEWTWQEVAFAALFLLVVRPLAGWLGMAGYDCPRTDKLKLAFFGVRGMGSVFYVGYGQTHAAFADIEAVWRVTALVILVSVVVHGFSARHFMPAGDESDEVMRAT